MRTGDAQLELWLEAPGDRAFCLVVQSQRTGHGTKAWERPVYLWQVEDWSGDVEEPRRVSKVRRAATFNEAQRLARRLADKWGRA